MKRIIGRKAEWLKGDGKAYINTINAFQGIEIKSKFKVNELLNAQYHGVMGFLSYSALFLDGGISVVADRRNNKLLFSLSVVGDNTQNGPSFELGKPVDFEFKNNCYYINDDVIDSKNTKIDNLVIPIFTRIIYPSNISTSKSSIAFFEIVGKISLEPIMLTSDIPYTLASDNLPHAAGECGMWDSVGEKFYGNANSTGAFSVENELDEYVEVDLTGICINGKYQRVAVENTEIPQIVWNGVNARMLMLNGKVVYKGNSLKPRYELHKWLDFKGARMSEGDIIGCELDLRHSITERSAFTFVITEKLTYTSSTSIVLGYHSPKDFADGIGRGIRQGNNIVIKNRGANIDTLYTYEQAILNKEYLVEVDYPNISINGNAFAGMKTEKYNLEIGVAIRSFNGSISQIITESNTFTPCKMLTDVDAMFCADGMMHSAGECGMVDSNDIFYFNTSQYGYLDVSD